MSNSFTPIPSFHLPGQPLSPLPESPVPVSSVPVSAPVTQIEVVAQAVFVEVSEKKNRLPPVTKFKFPKSSSFPHAGSISEVDLIQKTPLEIKLDNLKKAIKGCKTTSDENAIVVLLEGFPKDEFTIGMMQKWGFLHDAFDSGCSKFVIMKLITHGMNINTEGGFYGTIPLLHILNSLSDLDKKRLDHSVQDLLVMVEETTEMALYLIRRGSFKQDSKYDESVKLYSGEVISSRQILTYTYYRNYDDVKNSLVKKFPQVFEACDEEFAGRESSCYNCVIL